MTNKYTEAQANFDIIKAELKKAHDQGLITTPMIDAMKIEWFGQHAEDLLRIAETAPKSKLSEVIHETD